MNAVRKSILRHREEKGETTIPMTIKGKEPHMPMHSMPSSRISPTARNDCSSGFA
jgi:hypothetical protein